MQMTSNARIFLHMHFVIPPVIAQSASTVKVNLQIHFYSLRLQNFNHMNRLNFLPAYAIEFKFDNYGGKNRLNN